MQKNEIYILQKVYLYYIMFSFIQPPIPLPISFKFDVNNNNIIQNVSISNTITQLPIINIDLTKIVYSNSLCSLIRTPDHLLLKNAPYMFDIQDKANTQELIVLKSMYNNISAEIFGAAGENHHPLTDIIKHNTLKNLEKSINEYCK